MCRRTHARRQLRHDATKLTKLTQEEKLKVPHARKYQCPSYTPGSAHVAAGLSESADPRFGVRGRQKRTIVEEQYILRTV